MSLLYFIRYYFLRMNNLIIEVVKKNTCVLSDDKVIEKCEEHILVNEVRPGEIMRISDGELSEFVQAIYIDEVEDKQALDLTNMDIKWLVYRLHTIGGQVENIQNDADTDVTTLSTNWMIPATEFHGLWENLIYDNRIKQDLLKYVQTMMLFSDKGVDSNIVCSNRVVLLHGPPGTGKTSLCKALAHKLSIRLKQRFSHAQLIEINSHSLFSKWFSESGKLVTTMFSRIHELIENPNSFVCVLIDEVESLAHARNQCISGNEPSDAIRVVNAVLTQIDQIKRHPNVLILTTSNMTEAIDLAFVDRADIKQYIGLPSDLAIYQIYYSCINELMRTGVIVSQCNISSVKTVRSTDKQPECAYSNDLMRISELSLGFSGRTLRKAPFIAHALFSKGTTLTITEFLQCLESAVKHLKEEKEHFVSTSVAS